MKSNEWKHVLASGILKFCIRGLLGDAQRKMLYEFCDVISLLAAEEVNVTELDSLEYRVHRVLSPLERDFPVFLHVFHLLHHLPMFIQRFGPPYGFWMYPMERFNSWVSRRVLNRRYPESTVLETYRLHEFTSFLQISGQLPENAIVEFIEGSTEGDQESNTNESDHSYRKIFSLNPSHWKENDTFYKCIEPEYQNIHSRYETEKQKAKTHRTMKQFPPLSQWTPKDGHPLSVGEMNLHSGPNDVIFIYNSYVLKDKHGRAIRYGSCSSERANTSTNSSYVYIRTSSPPVVCFGQIEFIFEHEFNEKKRIIAYMKWYNGFMVDRESGLLYINLKSYSISNPVVLLKDLVRPLIHAVDEAEPDKLWILNYRH